MRWGTSLRRLHVPASCANIDFARVERALVKHYANVRAAARELDVPSGDLRKLTWSHPRLIELALEEAHRLVDLAESKLREALDGDHPDRALAAATYILSHSSAAPERGWGPGGYAAYADDPPQRVEVCWVGDLPKYQATLSAASSGDQPDPDAPVH
jgi:hypothetical protein